MVYDCDMKPPESLNPLCLFCSFAERLAYTSSSPRVYWKPGSWPQVRSAGLLGSPLSADGHVGQRDEQQTLYLNDGLRRK